MKEYKPMICIDTCILNNLLGLDDEKNPKISEQYNKKKLMRYVYHHGYFMSDFNLYERLIKEDWNNEIIIKKLKRLNYRTYEKIKSEMPWFYNKMKNQPPIPQRYNFLNEISNKIVEFASDYYSRIIVYSYALLLQSLLFSLQKQSVKFDNENMSKHLEGVISLVRNIIKEEFNKLGLFTKTNAEKVVNKIFLIFNHLSAEWYNKDVMEESKNADDFNIGKVTESFIQTIKNYDFNDNMVKENGSVTSKLEDSVVNSLCEVTYRYSNGEFSKEIWNKKFLKLIKEIFLKQYDWNEDNKITNIYFIRNIEQLYFNYFENNENKVVKRAINTNDIIDLMSLVYAYKEGFVFITIDNGINRVLNKLYDNKQKEFVNVFISYKFNKN